MTAPVLAARVDAAHLSPESLTRLRASLIGDLAVQNTQAAACRAITNELTGQTDVDSILEREMAEASAARADEAVTEIQGALERLAAGTYGTCEKCARAIRFERLEAIPHARLCVTCPGNRSGLLG